MRIDNRTHWSTSSLDTMIRAALRDAGVNAGRELVQITYSVRFGFTGYCFYPSTKPRSGRPRMKLRLPRVSAWSELDTKKLAFLVRHEVAHWAGLSHRQMQGALREWPAASDPVPAWVPTDWQMTIEPAVERAAALHREPAPAKRISELETKVKGWERKLKLATTKLKKWKRKLATVLRSLEKGNQSCS